MDRSAEGRGTVRLGQNGLRHPVSKKLRFRKKNDKDTPFKVKLDRVLARRLRRNQNFRMASGDATMTEFCKIFVLM